MSASFRRATIGFVLGIAVIVASVAARAQKSAPPRDPALQEVIDRQQLRDLMSTYGYAVDKRDYDLLLSILTPDVSFDYNNGQIHWVGAENYPKLIKGLERYRVTMHFMGNQIAQLHGDSATLVTYANAHHVLVQPDGSEMKMMQAIRYNDEAVKVDGKWKTRKRVMEILWQQNDPVQKVGPARPSGTSPR
jgi:hypothetical protein